MENIKVGLIGFGKAAQVFHAPLIQVSPELHLKKVVERHHDKSKSRYPWVEVVRSVEELLEDETITLVVIATPNDTHFPLAKQAILANKHVVVDKPMAITSKQARDLIDLAKRQNVILSVFHNRRWDGDFLTVRQLLAEKKLGRLVEFESHFDRFRNLRKEGWREKEGVGTGILYDLGSHLIDQALILFGLPQMVMADLRIQRDTAQVIDNFELILFYPNLKVSLKAGMLVREPQTRFILHGMNGSYVKYGLDPQEDALKKGLVPGRADWGEELIDKWGKINTDFQGTHIEESLQTQPGAYENFYNNIANVILHREKLHVKAEEAMNTMRIIELALQSHEKKCIIPYTFE
ncbi:MAG: oxidoreductase [Balneolales bacterium]